VTRRIVGAQGDTSAQSRPLIAVLDYGIGNLRSAQKSLERMGADARLTADAGLIAEAAGVVLPGVGAFGPCMAALCRTGLDEQARAAAAGKAELMSGVAVQLMLIRSSWWISLRSNIWRQSAWILSSTCSGVSASTVVAPRRARTALLTAGIVPAPATHH